jgi:hypothetical protein
MARNGAGTYLLPTGNPVVTGTTINSSTHNTTMTDIATALTQSVATDGQTPMTANLPMGANKITGLAAGSAASDAIRMDQAAKLGANNDITALTALTTPLTLAQGGGQLQTILATVAANALTATLNPTVLDFRSATLGSGTVNKRTVAAAISVVVPSTATLGTINATQSRIIVLAIDNAGTVELAVVNIAGGNSLDETALISTTAISAAATANNVIYSTTARTNVPFRVVGYIESTQATAGTWATAPSTIQGAGGDALSTMSGLGYGQTWQDVKASRVVGTTYYNTTGRPIFVSIQGTQSALNGSNSLTVGGVVVSQMQAYAVNAVLFNCALVPPGASYSAGTVIGTNTPSVWAELR